MFQFDSENINFLIKKIENMKQGISSYTYILLARSGVSKSRYKSSDFCNFFSSKSYTNKEYKLEREINYDTLIIRQKCEFGLEFFGEKF